MGVVGSGFFCTPASSGRTEDWRSSLRPDRQGPAALGPCPEHSEVLASCSHATPQSHCFPCLLFLFTLKPTMLTLRQAAFQNSLALRILGMNLRTTRWQWSFIWEQISPSNILVKKKESIPLSNLALWLFSLVILDSLDSGSFVTFQSAKKGKDDYLFFPVYFKDFIKHF